MSEAVSLILVRCFFNLLHHVKLGHGVGVCFVPKHQHKLKGKPAYQCALGNSVEHICWCADELIFNPCRCLKSLTVPNQARASICGTLANRSFGQREDSFPERLKPFALKLQQKCCRNMLESAVTSLMLSRLYRNQSYNREVKTKVLRQTCPIIRVLGSDRTAAVCDVCWLCPTTQCV